jgi:hypothetical protein
MDEERGEPQGGRMTLKQSKYLAELDRRAEIAKLVAEQTADTGHTPEPEHLEYNDNQCHGEPTNDVYAAAAQASPTEPDGPIEQPSMEDANADANESDDGPAVPRPYAGEHVCECHRDGFSLGYEDGWLRAYQHVMDVGPEEAERAYQAWLESGEPL